ncbi:MAG: AAA family ATPase [Deltaproteobacteria bacterium]|nr:AAA family ATPase [Deltaproteobacteria bacterium]
MPRKTTNQFFGHCKLLLDSSYQLIYVVTWEEQRFLERFQEYFKAPNIYHWSCVSGLQPWGKDKIKKSTVNPIDALDTIINLPMDSIVVFKDFHKTLEDHSVVRKLKEVIASPILGERKIIILSPVLYIPVELEKSLTVLDFPLPSFQELNELLYQLVTSYPYNQRTKVTLTSKEKELLIDAARGLTYQEARKAFKKCFHDDATLSAKDIETVLEQKRQAVRKSGFLEYFHAKEEETSVGGVNQLKIWLNERGNAFTQEATDFGLPDPKGILLMGVQGCGKSLIAKAISNMWKMPLLRFDMGKVFGSFIGSSESNMRKAIETAEAVAPCILWVDEIEKAVSGMAKGITNDGGTSARVFSTFLTWLQEKQDPVFVVATANQIDQLPPELIRKGRLDEIFFVDLPNELERKEVLEIHLQKRKQNEVGFDTAVLAAKLDGYSGAEIEQVVIAAMYKAFFEKRTLQEKDLVEAIEETYPLSTTMEEEIQALRKWSIYRARKAS